MIYDLQVGGVAQMVERSLSMRKVRGIDTLHLQLIFLFIFQIIWKDKQRILIQYLMAELRVKEIMLKVKMLELYFYVMSRFLSLSFFLSFKHTLTLSFFIPFFFCLFE